MSWHTSGILIRADRSGDPVGLLDELGFPGAEEVGTASFEDATSVMVVESYGEALGAAVATIDGWTSIWGPFLMADEEALARLSRGGSAFICVMEGASGTYGFAFYRDGALVRRWMEQSGEALTDEGDPLPEEEASREADDDPESMILDLVGRLALPLARLDEAEYTLYRIDTEA